MIQLTVYPQGSGTPINLDLADDARVSFSLSFADPGRPTTRSSPFSSTFTLPFTQKNDAFFGHFCEVNLLSGSFNPSLRVQCIVASQGSPVFEGYLQLRSVSLQARTYEANVVGAAGDHDGVVHLIACGGDPAAATNIFSSLNIESSFSILIVNSFDSKFQLKFIISA